MKEMCVDAEGNLYVDHLYTGLGPVEVQTYFEEAVRQALLNDEALQVLLHLSLVSN